MTHPSLHVLVAAGLLFGAAATVSLAQPPSGVAESRRPGDYRGVTPEGSNTPPRHGAAQREAERRLITWPGFQLRADGGSRFFMQVTGNVQTQITQSEGRVEVLLQGTRTHLRNTRRYLETRYFNTPVLRARIERRGEDLALVMHMRAPVSPQVTQRQGANGYQFIFVDFPSGTYIEDPAPAPRAAEPRTQQRDDPEDPPSYGPQDDERPPGL